MKKRFIALISAAALFMPCLMTNSGSPAQYEEVVSDRVLEVLNSGMEELVDETNSLCEENEAMDLPTMENVEWIHNFGGGTYLLAEYKPTGYIIFDVASGTYLERSAEAVSPFKNATGNKYYGGINEYYSLSVENGEKTYTNTVYGNVLSESAVSAFAENSEIISEGLSQNANTELLSYINDEDDIEPTSTSSSYVYISNRSFFGKLDLCGDTSVDGNGICGYIAAGILLTYDTVTNGYPLVDSDYYSQTLDGRYIISSDFHLSLYNLGVSLGYGASTTSVAIHYTVNQYLKNRGVTASHTSLYVPFGNNITIRSKINNNRPVIWFGALGDQTELASADEGCGGTTNHAVVVYGYKSGTSEFIAHSGWSSNPRIQFSGILGSLYTYEIKSVS